MLPGNQMDELALNQPQRNECPDCFYYSKRPSALQESVSGTKSAGRCRREDELAFAILEGIAQQHGAYGKEAESCETRHDFGIFS
jgi:hypothetical protein